MFSTTVPETKWNWNETV